MDDSSHEMLIPLSYVTSLRILPSSSINQVEGNQSVAVSTGAASSEAETEAETERRLRTTGLVLELGIMRGVRYNLSSSADWQVTTSLTTRFSLLGFRAKRTSDCGSPTHTCASLQRRLLVCQSGVARQTPSTLPEGTSPLVFFLAQLQPTNLYTLISHAVLPVLST